ncbi:glutamine--fructose-6-phosphate transaminase (isomerizing) [Ketobacter alkanivorans]|uniref:Glutamine--fructose-6-phosphate aminotransferase [isomerizing] n=1 Tax=Ketobacter alkanivorans TaxID=1917421 RepID=A0A2K9LL80_9GAMM|nr:glutamine--fructose-6-phosphate transaminase (isomerizing) [Ketobacter alkanivorans]AUM13088.1 glutamine--fructose-6-phosphate transaminase (isomerizing) [Ketobacter alkanivorans]
MCGIVGVISTRDVTPILLEGLRRLEYRGYDSAGIARFNPGSDIERIRRVGKVKELEAAVAESQGAGTIGIAHTRWATHGVPSESNAHPHMSSDNIVVVHNGIIENHEELRASLQKDGYVFTSETDTEVVAHLVHQNLKTSATLLEAVKKTTRKLRGAYALGVICKEQPELLIAAREGSPLVLGVGLGENFIASDQLALLPVTTRFIFLEEGDIAEVRKDSFVIENREGNTVERTVKQFTGSDSTADKGEYRHYMLKEIFEQPTAVRNTLDGRVTPEGIDPALFGTDAEKLFPNIESVQIIACGTSYHAGLVAKYWLEGLAGVQCNVEVASEFRYRRTVVRPNTLFVTISQSGETADTLAALRDAKGYLSSLAICNVATSSLVRESAMSFLTKAGPEIGVASTKAFTTQLVALYLMTIAIGKFHDIDAKEERRLLEGLQQLPDVIQSALRLNKPIEVMAEKFAEKHHALFLGRGVQYPIALEGALKLKEISYIHAEAYPAGELKHGPLALVDADMPVVTVAPSDTLLEKLKSNLQEVRARGGELFVFQDSDAAMEPQDDVHVLDVPKVAAELAPIVYTIPLQLLSYHVAIIKGTDVDQPRNLAKSVTVE